LAEKVDRFVYELSGGDVLKWKQIRKMPLESFFLFLMHRRKYQESVYIYRESLLADGVYRGIAKALGGKA